MNNDDLKKLRDVVMEAGYGATPNQSVAQRIASKKTVFHSDIAQQVVRLQRIKDRMVGDIEEARKILLALSKKGREVKQIVDRADSYWYPSIRMALDNTQEAYLGSEENIQDTINELQDYLRSIGQ